MTYRDNARGRFTPGVRVKDLFISLISRKDLESHGKNYLNAGHPIHLVQRPAQYDWGNYPSNKEHQEKSAQDIRCRAHMLGQLEGPHYYNKSWVVNP